MGNFSDGKISHEIPNKLVETEYEKFRIKQDTSFQSDFEQAIKKIHK